MAGESWKHYFIFSTIDNNRTNGLCKLCNQNYKDKSGSSSNFLKHLKRKHHREHQQIFPNKEQHSSDDISIESNDLSSTDSSGIPSKQNTISLAIAKHLIVRCNMPLNLVENAAFRDFIKDCGIKWNPISSKKLKTDFISSFVEKVNANIRETCHLVNHFTLTVDGWSDRRSRSFLGYTCHFINNKMEPSSFLIDFLRLKSPHTGENIHEITDNASSMIKAFKFGLSGEDESVDHDDKRKLMATTSVSFDEDGKKNFFTQKWSP